MPYSTIYHTHPDDGGGYLNAAYRNVGWDGNTIRIPERVDELRKSWVTGHPLADVDNYAEGFADTISYTSEAQRKYTTVLTYSGAYSDHLERERLLNRIANKSKNMTQVLDSDMKVIRTAEIAGKTAGGAGTAASVLAAAPVHAMLGPFAAISIPLRMLPWP